MNNLNEKDDVKEVKSVGRNSGIEILKIVGVVLIIISHVTKTLSTDNMYYGAEIYTVDLSSATRDIGQFILSVFRYFGVLGNSLFFVSSAWFLLESSRVNVRKWFFLLCEVWVVSVTILATTTVVRGGGST